MGIKRMLQIDMGKCQSCSTYFYVRLMKDGICQKCQTVKKSELTDKEIKESNGNQN